MGAFFVYILLKKIVCPYWCYHYGCLSFRRERGESSKSGLNNVNAYLKRFLPTTVEMTWDILERYVIITTNY